MKKKYKTTVEEDLEMLPCPFCKGVSLITKQIVRDCDSKGNWYIHCEGCWADGPFAEGTRHQGDAVKAWNKRGDHDQINSGD